MINPDSLINRLVFDFDENVREDGLNGDGNPSVYDNDDIHR